MAQDFNFNATEFFIFRHGETDWNRQERFQGHSDIALNSVGFAQARSLIDPVTLCRLDLIYSSDLTRAVQTAETVAGPLQLEVRCDPRLREAHLGKAQGKTRDEIEKEFGRELASRWRSSHVSDADVAYPGGESGQAIIQRVFEALEEFAIRHPRNRIGISTHGGVIRRIFQKIQEGGPKIWVPIPNGIIYRIRYDLDSRTWRHHDFFELNFNKRRT